MKTYLCEIMDKVTKPWGYYIDFVREENKALKELGVNPGSRLSLQSHQLREEYWTCMEGEGIATLGDSTVTLSPGTRVYVPRRVVHRISNTGKGLLRIAELQLGICDENDIRRYEDDFGRVAAKTA